jgi:hypothetical protein
MFFVSRHNRLAARRHRAFQDAVVIGIIFYDIERLRRHDKPA